MVEFTYIATFFFLFKRGENDIGLILTHITILNILIAIKYEY